MLYDDAPVVPCTLTILIDRNGYGADHPVNSNITARPRGRANRDRVRVCCVWVRKSEREQIRANAIKISVYYF